MTDPLDTTSNLASPSTSSPRIKLNEVLKRVTTNWLEAPHRGNQQFFKPQRAKQVLEEEAQVNSN